MWENYLFQNFWKDDLSVNATEISYFKKKVLITNTYTKKT